MAKTDGVMRHFINAMVESGTPLKIITKNGYQMLGTLAAWDSQALIVNVNGTQQLVLMEAVSTIIPVGS